VLYITSINTTYEFRLHTPRYKAARRDNENYCIRIISQTAIVASHIFSASIKSPDYQQFHKLIFPRKVIG